MDQHVERDQEGRVRHALATEIVPHLPRLAEHRRRLAAAFRREALIAVAAAALAVAALLVLDLPLLVILALFVAAGAIAFLYARRRRDWTAAALDRVVPPVVTALGATRHDIDPTPDLLQDFEALGLVGAARHRIVTHRIEGAQAGTRFLAQHVTLARARGRGGASTRLFHGLLLRVALPEPEPARIMIMPARGDRTQIFAGVVRTLLPPAFARIEIGDPDFEARYHVLAETDGDVMRERIRAFLAPGFRRALALIDREEGSDGRPGLRAAFANGHFYLALPRLERPGWGPFRRERLRPFIDPGGLRDSSDLEAAVAAMARDLALPHRIVDRLIAR
jgi:hypothetical protein